MKIRLLLWIAIEMVLLVLAGCGPTETGRRLQSADAVMESDPDSALVILDGIDRLSLNGEDLPYYALLKTQADVKTYVDVDSDSLISIAMEHYADSKDEERRKRAYFYTAQVEFYRRDYPAAMRAVLPAYECAKEKKDYYWTAKAAELMADIFAKTYIYPQEEKYREEAAVNYLKADKLNNHRFALCDLAIAKINDNRLTEGLSLLDSLYRVECHSSSPDSILLESIFEAARIEFLNGITGYDNLRDASESCLKSVSPASTSSLQYTLLNAESALFESAADFDSWLSKSKAMCQDSTEYVKILYLAYLHAKNNSDLNNMALLGDTIINIQSSTARKILSESMLAAYGYFYQQDSDVKSEALRYSKLRNAFFILLTVFIMSAAIVIYAISYKRHKLELEYRINLIYQLEKEIRTKTEDNECLRTGLQRQKDSFHEAMDMIDRLVSSNKMQKEDIGLILKSQWKLLNALCKEYYESLDDTYRNKALTKKIETEIRIYTSEENLRHIERAVNLSSDGIVSEFRRQFPKLNEKDYAMLSLSYAGFSAKAICLFLNLKYKNFFLRRTRLVEKIRSSDVSEKDSYIQCLTKTPSH